jgi:hypothetical protein
MRKDYRQNYRMGTNPFGKKSNLQKIAETFGPKKKVKKDKKPTKRMFANVGGGAKKKKKFPDMSGDGKVTMKDVLMARGVIPKKKKTKKKVI